MALVITRLDTTDPGFDAGFARLANRRDAEKTSLRETVAAIVGDVRERGDDAVIEATARFDGYTLSRETLAMTPDSIAAGAAVLAPEDRAALELAARRIRDFHSHRVPESWTWDGDGERLGQLVRPLRSVGLYVPAALAPLASTTLMLAMPASVAGVRDLVMTSPGRPTPPAILAAAELAGVSRLHPIGGAQAIAALAYGTETIEAVDKIVGPGSPYTQEAKLQVFGEVAIDAEAGPSEVFIVADDGAPVAWLAADLLAQAEHGETSSVALATPSADLAGDVVEEIERQLDGFPRADAARVCLRERSAIIVTRDIAEAVDLANDYAAEHLQLMLRDPEAWLPRIDHAGAVFVGNLSTVPLGDYVAGPSHVLPTGGTARFFSVVGVEDFTKRMSVIQIEGSALDKIGPAAVRLATLEGLDGHARAVQARLDRRAEDS